MTITQESTMTASQHTHTSTCDICHQPILSGEKVHDDGDEIAHTACIRNWFKSSFGREGLR